MNDNILEFESVGFSRASEKLMRYIRKNNINIKIFNPAKSKGADRKYGPNKILGDYYRYYYKVENKKEFIEFLVDKFYKTNPNPSLIMKKIFTYMLHNNGLDWQESHKFQIKKSNN